MKAAAVMLAALVVDAPDLVRSCARTRIRVSWRRCTWTLSRSRAACCTASTPSLRDRGATLRVDANARVRERLERRGSPYRLVRRIRPRLRVAGRRRIALGRLRPGRYGLRLRCAAADGRRAAVGKRFRVRAP